MSPSICLQLQDSVADAEPPDDTEGAQAETKNLVRCRRLRNAHPRWNRGEVPRVLDGPTIAVCDGARHVW